MFNPNIYFPPAVLFLFIRGVAAAEGSTEFTLNLFTDIAPILALFGEQFAQQYLSQSFTWLDHLIFACVPLGIITALSGAIRTRGPRLARSFIGRARENLATVEIGLMSSVSHEVCEMFNGSGIIRTMGRSTLAQIMIFPDEYDAAQSGSSDDPSCGIHTLQTALQSKTRGEPLMVCSKYQGKTNQRLRKLLDPNDLALKYPYEQMEERFDFKCPPNLQLNLSTGQSSRSRKAAELLSASITAVALQFSLLVIAAVVVYHSRTSRNVGYKNNLYGFPCYAAGSALLCAGMAICSAAIESSTDEFVWTHSIKVHWAEVEELWRPYHNPYIMWIQQTQSVGDQTFDSYAILGGSKPYVLTSSRSKDLWTGKAYHKEAGNVKQSRTRWWEVVTMVGVLFGSLGFIVQFIGLRGLPWPVAVSQLLAILIMALARALIRRGVGLIPLARATPAGYELDFLASEIVFQPKFRKFRNHDPSNDDWRERKFSDICQWKVMTPNKDRRLTACTKCNSDNQGKRTGSEKDSCAQGPRTGSNQQLVNVRERLGDLCKWKTGVSETAVGLAQLIEHFMTIFSEKKKPRFPDKIPWAIKTSTLRNNGNDEGEETTVQIERRNEEWVTEPGKIEAILSLWMASIKVRLLDSREKRDSIDNRLDTRVGDWRRSSNTKVRFDRIVGDSQSMRDPNSSMKDIAWWVGDDVISTYDKDGRKEEPNFSIGFDTPWNGRQQHPDSSLRLIHSSTATLPSIMAQHLFTSFIWAISEYLPKNSLHQGEDDVYDFVQVGPGITFNPGNMAGTRGKVDLSHSLLASVVKEGESIGLGTKTDILLCMVPALSFRDLLPNDVIIRLMPPVREGIQQYGWLKMTELYDRLLAVCIHHEGGHFAMAALVETIEFAFLASPSHDLGKSFEALLREITGRFPETLKQLAPGYHLQNRSHELYELFKRCGIRGTPLKAMLLDQSTVGKQEFATFRKACGWTRTHEIVVDNSIGPWTWTLGDEIFKPDIFGWTPLHYIGATAAQDRPELIYQLGEIIRAGRAFSCLDKSKRSPFHTAAYSGHTRFLEVCIEIVDTDALQATLLRGGLDGKTPLHLAVEGQHQDCVELLLEHLAPGQGDIRGRTPMHLAAIGRSHVIGKMLLAHFSEPLQADELGNTPLTYLLRNENDCKVDQGRLDFAKELMATWTVDKRDDGSGNSLLHYAAALCHDTIESLVQELGNIDIPNRQGQTPLHLALHEGRAAAARKLISLGAQVERVDGRGWSALHYAVDCRVAELDIVSSILKAKRDAINMTEKSERTPLHTAAAAGNASAVMLLVSEGAELNARDKRGDTPLRLALRNNRIETTDRLLSYDGGLDICKPTDRHGGFEHIDFAVRRCNTECLETVLLHAATSTPMRIHGLKAMVTDRKWELEDTNVFHRVFETIPDMQLSILDLDLLIRMAPAANVSEAMHQAWMSRRYDLEALKEDPWALHYLAQHGDIATLSQLLEAGADASLLDKDNWMPSDVAYSYDQNMAGHLLKEQVAKTTVGEQDRRSHPVPSSLRDIYQDPDITIKDSREGLEISVTPTNPGLPSTVFRTQECIPHNARHFYFEAWTRIKNERGKLYIGFCGNDLPRDKLPGQHPGSWSYEISNATLTAWGLGKEGASSQTIGSGGQHLQVGCGLNMLTGEGFVTLNGKRLSSKTVFDEHRLSKGKIYPCVAFSTGQLRGYLKARINFTASASLYVRS